MNKQLLTIAFIFALVLNNGLGQSTHSNSSFEDLRLGIVQDKEHITVLNFWATWCKPCVAELPDFEKVNGEFSAKKVKVILANLDFNSQADSILPLFIKNKNIQSKVVHITDQDPNDWINTIWHDWSGTIPVTAIYYKGEKIWFMDGPTDYETLKSVITKYITQ